MLVIIETCGKQYQVEEGRYVDFELLEQKEGDKVEFDKVIMVVDGEKSKVGQPYIKNAKVKGTVLKHDKEKKVIVYKQRAKKGYRKKQGHRQSFTRVMIDKIQLKEAASKKAATAEETKTEE